MHVPLEILRLILDHLGSIATRSELITLRHVNSVFNEETLALLFTDSDQPAYSGYLPKIGREHHPITLAHMNRTVLDTRFINSAKWTTTPPALQQAYLSFRLTHSTSQPSLFAGLLTGVRQMLSGHPSFPSTEPDLTSSLLSLCAHDRTTSWIVAHHTPNLYKLLPYFHALTLARHRPRPQTPLQDDPYLPSWTSELDLAHHYALVAHALLSSDVPSALHLLSQHTLTIYTTTLCFGTSILGFALQKCSLPVLRALLAAHPLTRHQSRCGATLASAPGAPALERHPVYDVLDMATKRTDGTVQEALSLVYVHLEERGCIKGTTDADALFVKAVAAGCEPLVRFLVERADLEMYGRRYVDVFGAWIEEVEGSGRSDCFSAWRPFEVRLRTEWPKWSGRLVRERVESLRRSRRMVCERMGIESPSEKTQIREGGES